MDKMTLIIFVIITIWAIITTIRMISLDFELQEMREDVSKFQRGQSLLNLAMTKAIEALEGPTYGHIEEDKTDETRS